jgi:hypothetical protein
MALQVTPVRAGEVTKKKTIILNRMIVKKSVCMGRLSLMKDVKSDAPFSSATTFVSPINPCFEATYADFSTDLVNKRSWIVKSNSNLEIFMKLK